MDLDVLLGFYSSQNCLVGEQANRKAAGVLVGTSGLELSWAARREGGIRCDHHIGRSRTDQCWRCFWTNRWPQYRQRRGPRQVPRHRGRQRTCINEFKGGNEYFKKSFKKRSLESSIPCCFWKDEPKQEIPRWEIEGERGSYQKRPL